MSSLASCFQQLSLITIVTKALLLITSFIQDGVMHDEKDGVIFGMSGRRCSRSLLGGDWQRR